MLLSRWSERSSRVSYSWLAASSGLLTATVSLQSRWLVVSPDWCSHRMVVAITWTAPTAVATSAGVAACFLAFPVDCCSSAAKEARKPEGALQRLHRKGSSSFALVTPLDLAAYGCVGTLLDFSAI